MQANGVRIDPRWSGALAFWAGSDHYSLKQAVFRAPFYLPVDRVLRVYEVKAKSLIGLGSPTRYAIEYQSERRRCFITLERLPEELEGRERKTTNPPGAALLFFQHCWNEPSALLLPLLIPFFLGFMIVLLGIWNEFVLHNREVLSFFAKPGCDLDCVRKVLSIHSLVLFLFLAQISLVLLPIGLLVFQAPRYKSALNYRMIQSYSLVTVVVGVVVLGQLITFFPFRQYGRFVGLGFGPKVERVLSKLNQK
jgi:hypothetical protein